MDGWTSRYRSALRHRDLRLLLGGLSFSLTGEWAYAVALLAFVYQRTHSLAWVGAATLVRYLPPLLLSAYGGVLAERTERIFLMVRADLLSALWQAGLVVLAVTNGPAVLALVFGGLASATAVVYPPAVSATVPSIVSEDDLVAANALNGSIEQLVIIVGPAVGAGLLLISSATWVFGFNTACLVVSALLVSRIRTRSRPVDVTDEGRTGLLKQMAVGARTIISLPAARTLVGYCVLVSFVYGTDNVLFVAVSEHRLGTGPEGFGYLLVGMGLGGILMAAAIDRISRSSRLSLFILAGVVGYTVPTALLAVTHSPGVAFAIQVFRGASTLVVDVMAITALQRSVPSDKLARVFGVFFAFVLAAITLGALVTPPLVTALGLNGALVFMATVPCAVGLLGYPSLRSMDRATAEQAALLAPKVAVLAQLGIFAAASRSILERLAAVEEAVSFEPATTIVREGERADALYVLVEGEVEVTAHGEAGEADHRIRTMVAPTYFGEIGVLEHIPRTATVTALTPCRCERIDGETLLETLSTSPPSSSLMENARSRLMVTHPSREVTFTPAEALAGERR
jgi:predicted MFS family arabinose efflux permease